MKRKTKEKVKIKKIENVKILELSETYKKVLFYFFSFPQHAIGLNYLSKNIKSSKNAVKEAVNLLVNEGFLSVEQIGKAWRITTNQKHSYFITRKIPYNLQLVYESNIIKYIYKIIQNARAIILFGSYRWGSDNENSDIDIAVEVLDNEELRIFTLGIIEVFGLRKNVKINIHVFSRNKINLNLLANITNGIILDGFFEVRI